MPKPAKWIVLGLLIAWAVLPEWPRIPVEGASARDWNPRTFWFEPWGRSGVHKGIDIFARSGTPVRSASYGLVLYRGEIALGGKVVLVLAPKWRLHYYAHLDSLDTYPGQPVLAGPRRFPPGCGRNHRQRARQAGPPALRDHHLAALSLAGRRQHPGLEENVLPRSQYGAAEPMKSH